MYSHYYKKLKTFLVTFLVIFYSISYSSINNNEVLISSFSHNINIVNDTLVPQTRSGKVIRDVGVVGKKVLTKIKELFAVKHKIPNNYIPIELIETYSKDSIEYYVNESNLKPELKLIYPRITPSKGYFSFKLGDYEYFKYFDDFDIKNINYIKLVSENGEECIVDKFELIKRESARRHFTFLLDHSGSMGKKRASILQESLFKAIKNNIQNDPNSSYSIYKFSEYSRLIGKGSTINSIKSALFPSNGLRGFGGGTAVKDALIKTITDINLINDKDFKAIILFTDGDSNSDVQTIPMLNVLRSANENNINIVSVAFGSYLDIGYLRDIATYSGGDLYHIYSPDEFENLFNNIFDDVILSYDIEFVPCFFGENIELEMELFSNDLSYIGSTVFRTPLKKGYTIDLSIEFDLNSSKINSSHIKKLNSLVQLLSFNKNISIIIEGHSDRLGSEASNFKLSKDRAESVKAYLQTNGVNQSRIKTKGFGSSKPAFSYKEGSDINPKNRRIQIVIDES